VLRELHVRNLAVVAGASVELSAGLNALTGETGAGKSIVVDSLALLAGARASAELIRSGAETLTVTGVFEPATDGWRAQLAEAGLEADGGELLVRREVSRTGRNRVFVNDQPTTLRLLAELAPSLLRIHGQHEELGLTTPDLQRQWLDRSGGAPARALLERVAAAYGRWATIDARLSRATGDERARRERLEMLHFQAREIDAVELTAGEEEALRAERAVLRHADAILRGLSGAFALLVDDEGAAATAAARAHALLEEIEGWEPRAADWQREADELRIRLEELGFDLQRRMDDIEADPARLDAVEERLVLVERLNRKYGGSCAEVLAHRRRIAEELDELEIDAAGRDTLEADVAAALGAYRTAALELSQARQGWGAALAEAIRKELRELGLGKAALAVELERRRRGDSGLIVDGDPVDFGPEGIDRVVFTFAPNPGEEPRPLAKIASGGELSRIYLALQLAARGEGEGEAEATLVFDEVDSGVGGAEAAALGKKLQRLARGGQILAVTHLPQVASHADQHFKISKRERDGRTFTDVALLDSEGRAEEVARMLAGSEVTELSRSHARELIAGAARETA
jgi:DNA repair protein RecN (Recombination protein N)